jgi:hypothetical protein
MSVSLKHTQRQRLILDAAGDFSFESFRLAWTVQYAIWILAVVGILITRGKTRRLMRSEQGAALNPRLTHAPRAATHRPLPGFLQSPPPHDDGQAIRSPPPSPSEPA